MTNFSVEVEALENEMIAWRRHLHANPELSFQETETSNFIAQQLASFGGIEILRPTATGVIGRVLGLQAGPGRVIGIRGDIDALPLREENDLPYRSTRPNVMHACGHDGHTAMLLGLAKLLSTKRANFPGEVRLVFQHAEELPPGGAVELVRAGAVEGVDLMLGLHLSTNYNLGTFGIKSGVLTAAVDRFDITLGPSDCGPANHRFPPCSTRKTGRRFCLRGQCRERLQYHSGYRPPFRFRAEFQSWHQAPGRERSIQDCQRGRPGHGGGGRGTLPAGVSLGG